MDFTERMLERNRSRHAKSENKESLNKSSQSSHPLKEVYHNIVTTTSSTSGFNSVTNTSLTTVDFKNKISSRSNKVMIETKVTMSKVPKRSSDPRKEVIENDETTSTEAENESSEEKENNSVPDIKCPLRQDTKSRLQRLGVLYSDDPTRLSSPIHRTEEHFLAEEEEQEPVIQVGKSKFRSARLAALAEKMNDWEDDMRHINIGQEAQGFTRSESRSKITYKYEDEDSPPSPPKSSHTANIGKDLPCSQSSSKEKSPVKTSPVKEKSPVKPTSPTKEKSPIKSSSPFNGRYGSPVQLGTSVLSKQTFSPQISEEEAPLPTMGVKQLRSPRKAVTTPQSGSVMDRVQRYVESTSPTKRCDPAELPLSERKALFERNAGVAVLPKAPFAMPVPVQKLQTNKKEPSTCYRNNSPPKQFCPPQQTTGSNKSLHDRLAVFEKGADNSQKDHMKGILSERQKEIEMLKHRYDKFKQIESHSDNFEPSAPPPSPPPPPPMPSPPEPFQYGRQRNSDYYFEDEEMLKSTSSPPQVKPEQAYPVLKEVKKFKLSPPKPGRIYPCLSDMETESEVQESEIEETEDNHEDNNRSSSSEAYTESLASDTNSLGQHIIKLSRSSLKRDWSASEQPVSEEYEGINEIDEFLDEALNESSDEPTPPKRSTYCHDLGSEQSTSFEYSQDDGVPNHGGPNHPLFHTISFYRKQQNMTLKPTSPVRQVQINPSSSSTDDSFERMQEEYDQELKKVEKRIEELHKVIQTQQTIISQTSQALNLCYSTIEFSGSTEQIEAEKHLLLATQRRLAALHEIQRLKVEETVRPKTPGNKVLTERGSIILSNITVPLKMDIVHQAAKEDQCYYIVCLVHSAPGDERVLCTDVMCAPRNLHSHNKITFPNTLTLDGLYSDFKVTLEVYTMTARNKEIIPHDVKYHINVNKKEASKLKLTPRKGKGESRMVTPTVQSPGGPSAVRQSAFSMAGYVIFSLREIQRTQFTLNKNSYTSVLEGSMQLKIDSEMSLDVEYRGFLTMFEDVSGLGAWHRRWCLLKGDSINYWRYPDDERRKVPLDTIDLSACTTKEVDLASKEICVRPHTFLLEISRPARHNDVESLTHFRNGNQTIIRYLLSADTKEDRIQWCLHLNKALALMRAWGVAGSR